MVFVKHVTSFHPERAFFDLLGVLSPRRRPYPPACKPYGLEAEPEAAGSRLRCTDVRLAANPCAAFIRKKLPISELDTH
jgi:hypothetical protein